MQKKTKNIGSEIMFGTEEEEKERIAYERTLADTADYKAFRKQGMIHSEAIWATQKALNIVPKPPYKDESGKELKWFSISRLDPDLRVKAKKYWIK